MQEAIRRSLAEQRRQQAASGRRPAAAAAAAAAAAGGGEGGMEGMYRPIYPHVPVAEVVSVDDGPRLPSYEEATGPRRRQSREREL